MATSRRGLSARLPVGAAVMFLAHLACSENVSPKMCKELTDWSCTPMDHIGVLEAPTVEQQLVESGEATTGTLALLWSLPAGHRGYCLVVEENDTSFFDGLSVIRIVSSLVSEPMPELLGMAPVEIPTPAPGPTPSHKRGNIWSKIGHAVNHVVQSAPSDMAKGLSDLAKAPKSPPKELEQVLASEDVTGELAKEAETAFGSTSQAVELCSILKKENCKADCAWREDEARCGLSSNKALEMLAEAMAAPDEGTPTLNDDQKEGLDEMMMMLTCSASPKANCTGACRWLEQDHKSAAAAAQVAAATGATGNEESSSKGVCAAASFVDAADRAEGPSRVVHLSAACAEKSKEKCSGDCEWAIGSQKCEVEESVALNALGGPGLKNQALACKELTQEDCASHASCGWQQDYARCSVHEDSLVSNMMKGGPSTRRLERSRRLDTGPVAFATAWGKGTGAEQVSLLLNGLTPELEYRVLCAAHGRDTKLCTKSAGVAGDGQECLDAEPPELQHFKEMGTVWSANFKVHMGGDGPNTIITLFSFAMLISTVAGCWLLISKRQRIMRRFWARRIALPEDSELMACPVGPAGWTELH